MASKSTIESTAIMHRGVKTDIGVKDDARKKLVETLNMRLCDEYDDMATNDSFLEAVQKHEKMA